MFRWGRVLRELAPELKMEFLPVIFTKTQMGLHGGFAGEERLIKREVAQKYFEEGCCVVPNGESRAGVWTFNPETNQFDKYVERTQQFIRFAARKRQWLDLYWRVNHCYLIVGRVSWGQGWILNCPLRKRDVTQKLWEQAKVRIDWRLLEFREQDRATGIQHLGHNFCWLYMPGAEELQIDREVYDNKRAKVRIFVQKLDQTEALY